MLRRITPLFLLALVGGCESPSPDTRLAEQAQAVAEVREDTMEANADLKEARDELTQKREAVAEAERVLQAARKSLRVQRKRLAGEQGELAALATDTAQYRLLQQRLLSDPMLENSAIMSSVLDGRVTISGEVQRADERRRAEEIALGIPGIERVENLVEVDAEAP